MARRGSPAYRGQAGGGARRPSGPRPAGGARRPAPAPPTRSPAPAPKPEATGPVEIPATITVGGLAEILGVSQIEAIKALMRIGTMATVNQQIDFQTAAQVATIFGIPVRKPRSKEESLAKERVADETDKDAVPRPPIVTILGHVDHGKTTLLDAIRGTQVAASEAGGITQRIGAYQIEWQDKKISFIDTPGHQAFTQMRARGAQVTDIAVLVVAADDGVQPQTREALDHARAAKVPIIVAINKVDVPGADPNRVKQQLAELGLIVESYGGDVVSAEVSALKRAGIDELLESILLVSEIEEIKANPNRPGSGVVVESYLDRSRGSLATVIVRSGTVRLGDNVIVGTVRGRVRAMVDGFGQSVAEAGPSTPIQIMGLDGLPEPGDALDVVEDEQTARQLAETRLKLAQQRGDIVKPPTLAEVMRGARAGGVRELNLVVKTGSAGSIDAVRRVVEPLSTAEVQVKVIHASAGPVNEMDVMLAQASGGLIIAFETDVQPGALKQAESHGVEIRRYNIIYRLVEDLTTAIKGLVAPEQREAVLGRAVVQAVFSVGRRGKAAGFRVTEGKIARSANVRALRAGKVLYDGPIASLRHLKNDVRELVAGYEGGIVLTNFNDFEPEDILEAWEMQSVERVG
ncbi:MAG: translation initiation factor IF-2 [Chloroflexi bacterium]|nr:translation initiation factor IF-2 [Chloroflexota bacterium]